MEPIIIVTRHPDAETTIQTWGEPEDTRILLVDLGGSFDLGDLTSRDVPDLRAEIKRLCEFGDHLPLGHPARSVVEFLIETITDAAASAGLPGFED